MCLFYWVNVSLLLGQCVSFTGSMCLFYWVNVSLLFLFHVKIQTAISLLPLVMLTDIRLKNML